MKSGYSSRTDRQNTEKEVKEMDGKHLNFYRERCPQKHLCKAVKNCPMGALKQEGKKAPVFEPGLCTACGQCAGLCPKKVFVIEA
jgi:Fe-S-cluster-containing hydrogenase component 2